MTGEGYLKTLQKNNLFKVMFKQCEFKRASCCAVPNVLREVVPVPYRSWKVALAVQISFLISCLPFLCSMWNPLLVLTVFSLFYSGGQESAVMFS